MKEKNLEISLLTSVTSVKELDEIPEVKLVVFGPERHRQMILDYNNMIANYGTINVEIKEKEDELFNLQSINGIYRLFKGKKIDERIAVLEREIEEAEKDKKGLDLLVEEALKCIQRFEEEMKEAAKSVLLKYGLTDKEFVSAYNKAKRELIFKTRKAQPDEAQSEAPQKE